MRMKCAASDSAAFYTAKSSEDCGLAMCSLTYDSASECFAFLPIKPKFKFAVEWSWFLET